MSCSAAGRRTSLASVVMVWFSYNPNSDGGIHIVVPVDLNVSPPQEVADKIALAAQFYAGSLVGHPFRSAQFGNPNTSRVDVARTWREKAILPDDCLFCKAMTHDDIIRRVAGYQGQIDKEVLRGGKGTYYRRWLDANEDVPEEHVVDSDTNRRRFIYLNQNVKTEKRPGGWRERPFPLVSLSMRHKTKLCCTWNHILLEWMEENGLHYDFNTREYLRPSTETPPELPDSDA